MVPSIASSGLFVDILTNLFGIVKKKKKKKMCLQRERERRKVNGVKGNQENERDEKWREGGVKGRFEEKEGNSGMRKINIGRRAAMRG